MNPVLCALYQLHFLLNLWRHKLQFICDKKCERDVCVPSVSLPYSPLWYCSRTRLKRDGWRAETRFGLSAKRTSPFKSSEWSVHSTAGSRVMRISGSNAGCTMFCGTVQDYWLPTPLACFPFTSPTVHHRVPSGFNWALSAVTKRVGADWPSERDLRLPPPCLWDAQSFGVLRSVEW